jgi:hypothetical protein
MVRGAHCCLTPEATAPRPCLLSRNTGSATLSGRARDKRRPTLWATVGSLMLRDARPLAGGATERASASTRAQVVAAASPCGAGSAAGAAPPRRASTCGPPGRCSSPARGARRMVVVQRGNADTDELHARNAWQSSRAGSTAADGCVWANSEASSDRRPGEIRTSPFAESDHAVRKAADPSFRSGIQTPVCR